MREDAVVSLGVSRDAGGDGPPRQEDIYTETCPYIHVFASVDEYERWAGKTDAATTSLPVETGVAIARELARNCSTNSGVRGGVILTGHPFPARNYRGALAALGASLISMAPSVAVRFKMVFASAQTILLLACRFTRSLPLTI